MWATCERGSEAGGDACRGAEVPGYEQGCTASRVPDEYLIAAAYDPQLEELASDKAAAEEGINFAAADVERAQTSNTAILDILVVTKVVLAVGI